MYIYKKAKGGPSCRMRILRTNNYTKKTWHISPSKSNNQWPDISGKFMLLEWVGVVPEKNYRNISMKIPHYDIIVHTKSRCKIQGKLGINLRPQKKKI